MENNIIKAKNTNEKEKEQENEEEKKTFFPISSDLTNIIFYSVLLLGTIAICYYFYTCSTNISNIPVINCNLENTNVPIILDNIQNIPEISCKLENTNMQNISEINCKLETQ
jgi:hypothetical protein